MRLRHWTAAFFATSGISHLYWLNIRYGPLDGDLFDRILLCTALDCITSAPLLLCTMVVMLQDRRRPLWPIALGSALTLIYLLLIYHFDFRGNILVALPTLLIFIFFIWQLRAVGQYDRWLRENYADLEHKEARSSIGLLTAFVLISVSYSLANDYFFFEVLIEVANILLIFILLWRVETLQTLEESGEDDANDTPTDRAPLFNKIESLLQQYCVDEQFYLQHDVSVSQLAAHIGTNRKYLGQYFAQQGITYNSYINRLRIEYFISHYREAVIANPKITTRQLAFESGFSSYGTFSNAFKQITSQNVTTWLQNQ